MAVSEDVRSKYGNFRTPDETLQALKDMMLSGELAPGEKLNQRKLASRLGVTTTPLREAISKLERDGYVERIERYGVFVKKYTTDEIHDYFLLRELVEGCAARLCVERATSEDIDRLRQLDRAINTAAAAGKKDQRLDLEAEFHQSLVLASHSDCLQKQMEMQHFVQVVFVSVLRKLVPNPEGPERMTDHAVLIDAIEARDADHAEAITRKHVRSGWRAAQLLLEKAADKVL